LFVIYISFISLYAFPFSLRHVILSVEVKDVPEKVLDSIAPLSSHAQTIVYYTADKDCVEITENRNTSLMQELQLALSKILDGDELEFLFEEYLKRTLIGLFVWLFG
jgi:hypothetical protein